jgi:Family of unknown function (DUF5947)
MDPELSAERIAQLIEEIRADSPAAARKAEELLRAVLDVYGRGLTRAVAIIGEAEKVEEVRARLLEDELFASLLLLHGLHPSDAASRIRAALEKTEAGAAVLLGIEEDGTVRVRLRGARSVSHEQIERAVLEAAPETSGVRFEGEKPQQGALIQLGVKPANSAPKVEPPLPFPLGRRKNGHDAGDKCELCATPLTADHAHVVDVESRRLLCSCRPCRLLFTESGAAMGKYRAVPDQEAQGAVLRLSEQQWQRLQIPVRMAFFFFNSALGRHVSFYPGPAGATESLLGLEAWEELARENPALAALQPDVEALLVYGPRGEAGVDGFVVPINLCYELVGRVRKNWRGFDGGEEAAAEIESFFGALRPEGTERRAAQ